MSEALGTEVASRDTYTDKQGRRCEKYQRRRGMNPLCVAAGCIMYVNRMLSGIVEKKTGFG
jgi:hypothetical protein